MALCAGFKGAVLGLGFRVYGSVASEMREAFDELYPAMEKLDDPGFQVYWKSVVQIPTDGEFHQDQGVLSHVLLLQPWGRARPHFRLGSSR